MNNIVAENEIKIFEKEEFGRIRTIIIDGEPWFVGTEIATVLEYTNPRKAMADHVDSEDKNTVTIRDGIKGNPNKTIINESGLYSLILSSKMPNAKKFKRWVTSEVLPSIRKTGGYLMDRHDVVETMLSDMGCNMKIVYAQINNIENMLSEHSEKLTQVVDNITLSTRQQQKIYKAAKDRISSLLGGAHSKEYKADSKSYFVNLWNGLKGKFECGGSYKDLNPIYFNEALDWISEWDYKEN